MKDAELLSGLIVRAQSGFFDVQTSRGLLRAQPRGRHRLRRLESDLLAVGDRVKVRRVNGETAIIEEIAPRQGALSRRAPGSEREQVIVANPDQAVFVFSVAEPEPNFRMLDRLLVVMEEQQIPAVICVNKIDLSGLRDARLLFGLYADIGYRIFYTSAKTGRGVGRLQRFLRGRISLLAGPSGAGKTSLLNAIQPGLGLRTGEVSEATGKGIHTTVVPELIPLKRGGYVADTPGLKAFALWDIEPEELDGYFPELRPLVAHCAFSDCTHIHEPDCAVLAAVERGEVSIERYESYRMMRMGEFME
jgi:ribosome biogenesis GTPase